MTEDRENQLVSDIEAIKNSLKLGILKNPNEALTIQQTCVEFPIGYASLNRLCRDRKILYYREGGEKSTIYLKRIDLETYFYAEERKHLVNNHSKPL